MAELLGPHRDPGGRHADPVDADRGTLVAARDVRVGTDRPGQIDQALGAVAAVREVAGAADHRRAAQVPEQGSRQVDAEVDQVPVVPLVDGLDDLADLAVEGSPEVVLAEETQMGGRPIRPAADLDVAEHLEPRPPCRHDWDGEPHGPWRPLIS